MGICFLHKELLCFCQNHPRKMFIIILLYSRNVIQTLWFFFSFRSSNCDLICHLYFDRMRIFTTAVVFLKTINNSLNKTVLWPKVACF